MMRATLFATSFLAMQAVAVLGQEPVTVRVRVVDANTDGAMVAALVEVEGLGRSSHRRRRRGAVPPGASGPVRPDGLRARLRDP